jgi:hypothetical protein
MDGYSIPDPRDMHRGVAHALASRLIPGMTTRDQISYYGRMNFKRRMGP